MRLSDFKVLTFDVYGTLIDWEAGMVKALTPLTDRVTTGLTQNEILEAHAREEFRHEQHTPTMRYPELLSVVYRRLAEGWGVDVDWEECVAYGQSARNWRPFPDTVEALRYLKQHFQLVVLSNVDNATFAVSKARLGVAFDAIYTAEDIGSYKPSDRNFDYLIEQLQQRGYDKGDILHTADSLFHDHAPANRHGLHSCRIFRRRGQEGNGAAMNPTAQPTYDFCFDTMGDLANAHAKEIAAAVA